MNTTESDINPVESEHNYSDSDAKSWHCGCEYDPWPDDMFQGRGVPDPEFEETYEKKKQEGAQHHICSKQPRPTKKPPRTLSKVKKTKKAEKAKEANKMAEEEALG